MPTGSACRAHYNEALSVSGIEKAEALRAENERLKAEVKQLLTESFFKENEILNEERDRWREQAEKLAVALKMYATLRIGAIHWEHNDRFSYSESPAIEALAEFEAFKERIKN